MTSIDTILGQFFEHAPRLKATDLLKLIVELQHHFIQLPNASTKLESNGTLYINGVIDTSLGELKVRGITDYTNCYLCVAFGYFSLYYGDGSAYASFGGKRIALWTQADFFILK